MTGNQIQDRSTNVLAIAAGVALGLVLVLVLLWLGYSAVTANDAAECATENVERANLGLPARDCD